MASTLIKAFPLTHTHTWETPLVDGSLLKRVFCFPVHEQCDLMLYFSLSMCIAFTKSVRTKTDKTNKSKEAHFLYFQPKV